MLWSNIDKIAHEWKRPSELGNTIREAANSSIGSGANVTWPMRKVNMSKNETNESLNVNELKDANESLNSNESKDANESLDANESKDANESVKANELKDANELEAHGFLTGHDRQRTQLGARFPK